MGRVFVNGVEEERALAHQSFPPGRSFGRRRRSTKLAEEIHTCMLSDGMRIAFLVDRLARLEVAFEEFKKEAVTRR
jgi:hypothetical protein